MFAADSGAVQSAHCPARGDVAFYADGTQMEHMRWRQADRVKVRFKGHKGDQEQMGSVRVRTRTEVHGSKSSFRVDGSADALMLELCHAFLAFPTTPPSPRIVVTCPNVGVMSCFSSLPDHASLPSYRCDKSVRVMRYGSAL